MLSQDIKVTSSEKRFLLKLELQPTDNRLQQANEKISLKKTNVQSSQPQGTFIRDNNKIRKKSIVCKDIFKVIFLFHQKIFPP